MAGMTPYLLLFDIDGTLLKTRGVGVQAMSTVGARLFGPRFTLEDYDCSGKLDPIIFAEVSEMFGIADAHEHHDTFRDHYLEELERSLMQTKAAAALPGVLDTLEALRPREDVMLGLLTGNYTRAVPIKLRAVGIDPDWFTLTALGDEAPTRPDLVALALQRYERHTGRAADPRRVIVLGDTPRDIDCAHAHGCIAYAIATGRHSLEELQRHEPEVAVDSLTDPEPLWALLESEKAGKQEV